MLRKLVPPSSATPPLPPPVPADASHVIPGMKGRRANWALRLEHSTLAHLNSLGRTTDNPTELGFVRWPNPSLSPEQRVWLGALEVTSPSNSTIGAGSLCTIR